MNKLWQSIVNWFEHGDLVPLLVLVSAIHYIDVLGNKDKWFVAVAIGLLVDLGHYRWVRAAARYTGSFRWGGFTRWVFALAMTCVSLVYHERFYTDLWFSIPLPFLIASLAWLSKVDANVGKRTVSELSAKQAKLKTPKSLSSAKSSEPPAFLCDWCGETKTQKGKPFANVQQVSGHKAHCEKRPNKKG